MRYNKKMFDFHQKRKLKGIINSRLTQAIILLLAVMVGWSAYIRYDIAIDMRDRRQIAEQEALSLEARREHLAEQVEYLSSERGVEAELRRQFDVALPGEQVVVIVDEKKTEQIVQPLATSSNTNRAKWYQFWR